MDCILAATAPAKPPKMHNIKDLHAHLGVRWYNGMVQAADPTWHRTAHRFIRHTIHKEISRILYFLAMVGLPSSWHFHEINNLVESYILSDDAHQDRVLGTAPTTRRIHVWLIAERWNVWLALSTLKQQLEGV